MNKLRSLFLLLIASALGSVLYAQTPGYYTDSTLAQGSVRSLVELTDSTLMGVGERNGQFYLARFTDNATPAFDTTFNLAGVSTGELTHVAPAVNPNRFFAVGQMVDTNTLVGNDLAILYLGPLGDTVWTARYELQGAINLQPIAIGVDTTIGLLQVAFLINDSIATVQGLGQRLGILQYDSTSTLLSSFVSTDRPFVDSLPVVGRFLGAGSFRAFGVPAQSPAQPQLRIEGWEFVGQNQFQLFTTISDDSTDGQTSGLVPTSLTFLPDSNWYAIGAARVAPGQVVDFGGPQLVVVDDAGDVVVQSDLAFATNLDASRVNALRAHPAGGYLGILHEVSPQSNAPGDVLVRLDDAFNVVNTDQLLPLFGVTNLIAIGYTNQNTLIAGRLQATDATLSVLPNTVASLYLDTLTSGPIVACTFCNVPGDANQDALANVYDVLYTAAGAGSAGPPDVFQANNSLPLVASPRTTWSATFADDVNYAFADADGNGLLSFADTNVVSQNYAFNTGFVPNPDSANPNAPILQLNIPDTVALAAGDTLDFTVELGDPSQGVTGLLGVAFSLSYPKSVVEKIEFDASGGWIGNLQPPGTVADYQRTDTGNAQVDYGVFRTDRTVVAGVGFAATGKIIITDNLDGKTLMTTLPIDIINSKLIGANALPLPHRRVNGAFQEPTGRREAIAPQLAVYPNPSRGVFAVSSDRSIERIRVFAVDGRVLQTHAVNTKTWQMRDLPAGVLLVECLYPNGLRVHKRVVVQQN